MNYKNIITVEPGKRGGKPCIRGMRTETTERLLREHHDRVKDMAADPNSAMKTI